MDDGQLGQLEQMMNRSRGGYEEEEEDEEEEEEEEEGRRRGRSLITV